MACKPWQSDLDDNVQEAPVLQRGGARGPAYPGDVRGGFLGDPVADKEGEGRSSRRWAMCHSGRSRKVVYARFLRSDGGLEGRAQVLQPLRSVLFYSVT